MDTVFKEMSDGYLLNEGLCDWVARSLVRNNTFFPNVKSVTFNTKVEEETVKTDAEGNPVKGPDGRYERETKRLERPVLATIVTFADGTKVAVKNSDMDPVTLEETEVKLSDGSVTKVLTASQESMETGLVYALAKRLVCMYDSDGTVQNAGFANFLHEQVENARRQDVDAARRRAERRILKARAKDVQGQEKTRAPKPQKTSLRDTVRSLASAVEGLKSLLKGKDAVEG